MGAMMGNGTEWRGKEEERGEGNGI